MKTVSRLFIAAAAMVAASSAHAFTINFDENGWSSLGRGFLASDPTGTFTGQVLTFALPNQIGPGGVNILDLNGNISDNLFFYNTDNGGYMIFTSADIGGGALADTGVINFGFNGATERANDTFTYDVGNVYNGISGVPELSTWAMMLVGFAGLGFAGYRKSVKAAA